MDSKKASDIKKLALGGLVLGAFTVPVFRSGGRTGLTFVGWLVNHTIFGPPVEYVPEEDYTRELEGVEMPKQGRKLMLPGQEKTHSQCKFYIGGKCANPQSKNYGSELPSEEPACQRFEPKEDAFTKASQLEKARAYYQISEPSARELLIYQQGGELMEVTVSLKNPPSLSEEWQLILHDWNKAPIDSKFYIPITDPAVFEVPPGTIFPLRVDMIMFHNSTIDYRMQSVGTEFPFPPEWYVEAFIPDYGSYYYNVAIEQFELIELPEILPCEITITAPESAQEGEKVSVSALLRNVSNISIMYKIEMSAVPDLFPAFRIGTIEKNIKSGATFTAYGSFTMPASNTTILIWVERWAVDHWVYDSSASKVVGLEVVPEYRGIISKKELEYDGTRSIIPVY